LDILDFNDLLESIEIILKFIYSDKNNINKCCNYYNYSIKKLKKQGKINKKLSKY
jgi:hypothetical protein